MELDGGGLAAGRPGGLRNACRDPPPVPPPPLPAVAVAAPDSIKFFFVLR